jgi:hypothetical protein
MIVGGFIGNAGDMCWIGTSSYADDDDAITSTRILTWIKWLIAGLPLLLILSSILIVMGLTAWTVYTQEKTMDQYRFQSSSIHLTRLFKGPTATTEGEGGADTNHSLNFGICIDVWPNLCLPYLASEIARASSRHTIFQSHMLNFHVSIHFALLQPGGSTRWG